MKRQIAVIFGLIFSFALSASAQVKTVTNADLEKFRQQRLKAEREYRENYARLGFPSPEELERQNEENRKKREVLSERLRNERLQREATDAQNERNQAFQRQTLYFQTNGYRNYQTGGYYDSPYGYTTIYGSRYPRQRRFPGLYDQQVYPASGFFTVEQLQRIYTGQPFRPNNSNLRVRTSRFGVKINIGGGRKQ